MYNLGKKLFYSFYLNYNLGAANENLNMHYILPVKKRIIMITSMILKNLTKLINVLTR